MSTLWTHIYNTYFPLNPTSPGPYPQLAGVLYLYHYYVPSVHLNFFTFFGLRFHEKSLPTILAFNLFLSGYRSTLIPSLIGLLAGLTYTTEAFKLFKINGLPNWVNAGAYGGIGWAFEETGPTLGVGNRTGNGQGRGNRYGFNRQGRGGGGTAGMGGGALRGGGGNFGLPPANVPAAQGGTPGGTGGGATMGAGFGGSMTNGGGPVYENLPPAPEPPEETVEMLMGMGFERERVLEVLKGCDNNVEVAANRLIGGT